MLLTEKTRLELKDLVDIYRKREADKMFFDSSIELINKQDLFCEKIKTEEVFDKKVVLETEQKEYKIYVNYENAKKYINSIINTYKNFDVNFNELYNEFFLLCIIHECSHVRQSLYAFENISKYQEINELYRKLIDMLEKMSKLRNMIYQSYGIEFCFERNANIDAFRELVQIYDNPELKRIAEINHLYSLLFGYYEKNNKIITPVEKTFYLIGKKIKLPYNDLPFNVAFEHGLKVNDNDYNELIDGLDDLNIGEINYDSIIKKMKKLSK